MKPLFKAVLKICILLVLISVGSVIGIENYISTKMSNQISEDTKFLYSFMNREGKKLGKKYHMKLTGRGLGAMDKVWLIQLAFDRNGDQLIEEEARKFIVDFVIDFLETVNNETDLRPYLKNYPFTPKNLSISIHNWHQGHYALDPFITTVSMSEGEIGYFTYEYEDNMGYKTKKYEPFEEAVKKLIKE